MSRTPEPDYLDVDVIDEDAGALPVGVSARAGGGPEGVEGQTDELALDFGEPVDEEPTAEDAEEPKDAAREPEPDGSDDEYEYVADSSGLEAPSDTELELADSLSAARRRRHESKTAVAVDVRKYKFRKRMLMVMAALVIGSAVAAYTVTPVLWWTCGAIGGVTLLYLGYLRRQTRIEERLRRRRAQRIARSRLGRGEHRRQGVRRGACAVAAAGFGGAGDRRRGSDLRAPGLRPVRAPLRPAARSGPVASPVSTGGPRLVACATGIRGYGAVGSASRSHREGQGFESP